MINVYLPCRKGSKRVKNKNTRAFFKFKFGLFENKINQLQNVKGITKIIVSTDDPKIINYCKKKNLNKVIIIKRKKELSDDNASTDDLIIDVSKNISNGHILWTHVSSPFISAKDYEKIIKKYLDIIKKGYDSLMTVNSLQTFLWDNNKPINYNRKLEKWPRTQTLKKIYEVNSGIFLAHNSIYKKHKDRIGKKVYLYELDKITGFDIDWPKDFKLAEQILFSKII